MQMNARVPIQVIQGYQRWMLIVELVPSRVRYHPSDGGKKGVRR